MTALSLPPRLYEGDLVAAEALPGGESRLVIWKAGRWVPAPELSLAMIMRAAPVSREVLERFAVPVTF